MSNKLTLKATAVIGIATIADATLLPQAAFTGSETPIQLGASYAKNPCAANSCTDKKPYVGIQDKTGKTHPDSPYQKQQP